MNTQYSIAKQVQVSLESAYTNACASMKAFPKEANGHITDAARATPEYKAAKAALDAAFKALRNFNGVFAKQFKAEIAADRAERRK